MSDIKNKGMIGVLVVTLGLLGVGGTYLYGEYEKYQATANLDITIKQDVVSTQVVDSQDVSIEDENFLRRIDFDKLHAINDEVGAWLYVPNTKIDAVVMQEQTEGYYKYDLSDMYGKYNGSGSYMMPAQPIDERTGEPHIDAHTLILGHRMHNYNGEWMFSNVPTRWGSEASAKEFPYIYMYYPDRVERWQVWSGADAMPDDMVYNIPYEIGSDKYGELLEHMAANARYELVDTPDKHTKTLLLSTCHNIGVTGRFYVASVPDVTYYYADGRVVNEADNHQEAVWRGAINDEREGVLRAIEVESIKNSTKK